MGCYYAGHVRQIGPGINSTNAKLQTRVHLFYAVLEIHRKSKLDHRERVAYDLSNIRVE